VMSLVEGSFPLGQIDGGGGAAGAGESVADGSERGAIDQLHGIVELLAGISRGVNLDEIRVIDAGQSADFAAEAGIGLGVAAPRLELEGDGAAQSRRPGSGGDARGGAAGGAENYKR